MRALRWPSVAPFFQDRMDLIVEPAHMILHYFLRPLAIIRPDRVQQVEMFLDRAGQDAQIRQCQVPQA